MLIDNVIPISMSRAVEERVNNFGFRFGLEDFYYGLLSPKCHNVVYIDCFQACAHVIIRRSKIDEVII